MFSFHRESLVDVVNSADPAVFHFGHAIGELKNSVVVRHHNDTPSGRTRDSFS